MRLGRLPLPFLALGLGRLDASVVPDDEHRNLGSVFARLPVEITSLIFRHADLVAYATALQMNRNVPLVTSEVELRLLSDAAREETYLDLENDAQRARKVAILSAARAIVRRRSGLPTTIAPTTDDDTLKQLAARLEATFSECESLSFGTWTKTCMAALFGTNTLVALLPSLSGRFFDVNLAWMLKAAVLMGDLNTLTGIATYAGISFGELSNFIDADDIVFSDNAKFVTDILDLMPGLIATWESSLEMAIRLNRRPFFEHLYAESKRQLKRQDMEKRIQTAFRAAAKRGWIDVFKQLYMDYPQWVPADTCLRLAAAKDRINVLEYLLLHPHSPLTEMTKTNPAAAFEGAVGRGSIETLEFLLGTDKTGNLVAPCLYPIRLSPRTLRNLVSLDRLDKIEYLMRKKSEDRRFAEFELVDEDNTALMAACEGGKASIFHYLLRKDARGQFVLPRTNPAAGDNSPLIKACTGGHLLIVQELLRKDKSGNYMYRQIDPAANNNAPLIKACKRGHLLVVQELLQIKEDGSFVHHGVDPAARDNRPLYWACHNGHLRVVQELLQRRSDGGYCYKGIQPATGRTPPLYGACIRGHASVVRELLQMDDEGQYIHKGVDASPNANELLITAGRNGHLLVIQELLRQNDNGAPVHKGFNPAACHNNALLEACDGRHLPVIQELLRKDDNGRRIHKGIDLSVVGNLLLMVACHKGLLSLVHELLQMDEAGRYIHSGINPAVGDNEALLLACSGGHLPVIQELLRKNHDGTFVHKGINPATRNNLLLVTACSNGHLHIVQELLRHEGVTLAARNHQSLSNACIKGRLPVVKELLRRGDDGEYVHKGVDPAANDSDPLLQACLYGRLLIVRELLKHEGVDLAASDNLPLIAACHNGHLPVVQELLQKDDDGHYIHKGVDPGAHDNQCLIEACERGHLEVVKYLLQRRPNAHGVMAYVHAGIDVAARQNRALSKAVAGRHLHIIDFLLQTTEGGGRLFPGIAITTSILYLALKGRNRELHHLLSHLSTSRAD